MHPSPEIIQAFNEKLHPKPDAVGYLGKPDGMGGYIFDMPFRPGSLYARLQLGVEFEIGEVRAGGVARDPTLKLDFYRRNGVLTAVNPNPDGAAASYGADAPLAYLVPHPLNHHELPDGNIDFGGFALLNGGAAHFNAFGLDEDVQIQGLTDPDLLYTDASTDRVGIGTATPTQKLDVHGNVLIGGDIVANHITPPFDDTYDLGNPTFFYRAAYAYGVYLKTRSAPATPAANSLVLYAGTDKHPHALNEDGTDFDLTASTDPTAFHSNVSSEINALTDKPLPVLSDIVLGEDSQNSYSKIKLLLDNIKTLFLGFSFVIVDPVTTITNTTTETSLQSTGDPIPLSGLSLIFAGPTVVKTEAWGVMSTAAVAGNVEVRAYLESTIVADTGAVALPSGATDVSWYLLLFAAPVLSSFPAGGFRTWGKLILTLAGVDQIYPLNSGVSVLGSTDLSDGANFDVTLQYDTADPANVWNVVGFKCSFPPN